MVAPPAWACGGFFCDRTVPVEQNRERIVFGIDEDEGLVEVHVQVSYEGDAERFAWVVPVQGVPQVGLSTQALFDVLPNATQPRFTLQPQTLGSACIADGTQGGGGGGFGGGVGGTGGFPAGGSGLGSGPPPVAVLDAGTIGSYVWTTVSAADTDALLTWLDDNGYDLPPNVGKVLAGYLSGGSNFVAIKLRSGASTGDLAPLRLRYPGSKPSIPLVLTSVAATPDMRLETYVFGHHRVVPENYLHVRINEAVVDWTRGGVNYTDVITRAADEAGGQAFVTDFAGPAPDLDGRVWQSEPASLDALAEATNLEDVLFAWYGIGAFFDAAMGTIMAEHATLTPELEALGCTEEMLTALMQCAFGGQSCAGFQSPAWIDAAVAMPVDGASVRVEVEERIVTPRRDAQDLLDRFPTLTRLTSSMSPDEMTVDPVFTPNPDMQPVPQTRAASLVTDCSDHVLLGDAPRWLELSDGRIVQLPSTNDANATGAPLFDEAGPAALIIERTGPSGPPVVLRDQTPDAEASLDNHNATVFERYPYRTPDGADVDGGSTVSRPCGACGHTGSGSFGVAGLLALVIPLRRRRARQDVADR